MASRQIAANRNQRPQVKSEMSALRMGSAVVGSTLGAFKQANITAFRDTFFLLGVALIVAVVATILLKMPGQVSGAGAH